MALQKYINLFFALILASVGLLIWIFIQNLNLMGSIFSFILLSLIILFVSVARKSFSGDFEGNVDRSKIDSKWFVINKKDGGYLHACYLCQKNLGSINQEKKPLVIIGHGANCCVEIMDWISIPIVLNGFNVIVYNQSGHGLKDHKSSGNKGDYVATISDIHHVIDYIINDFVHKDNISLTDEGKMKIGFVGHSTGGLIALTQAYLRDEIMMTVAMSGIHDFMGLVNREAKIFSSQWLFKISLKLGGMRINYSEEENAVISPKHCLNPYVDNSERVYMMHCEDDPLPFDEALKNREMTKIPQENTLFLPKGGHGFRSQETIVIAKLISWLIHRFL